MKVVLVKESNRIRVLEGEGKVRGAALSLRSRLTAGEIRYYELDYDKTLGMRLEAYVEALNQHPRLLETSEIIKEIT